MKKLLMIIFVVIGLFYHSANTKVESHDTEKNIRVYVEGAIKQEGYYEVPSSKMSDLLQIVKLEENADLDSLDLNRILYHEDRVYIPFSGDKISLNKATKEELMNISGIGLKKAEKIIAQRPFTSIEQIMEVEGIGEKSYLKWREYLCL